MACNAPRFLANPCRKEFGSHNCVRRFREESSLLTVRPCCERDARLCDCTPKAWMRIWCASRCCQKGEDSMHTRILRCSLKSFLFVLACSTWLFSQNQPPVIDPQAVALATQAIAALTHG